MTLQDHQFKAGGRYDAPACVLIRRLNRHRQLRVGGTWARSIIRVKDCGGALRFALQGLRHRYDIRVDADGVVTIGITGNGSQVMYDEARFTDATTLSRYLRHNVLPDLKCLHDANWRRAF